jgi:hypothetical protein
MSIIGKKLLGATFVQDPKQDWAKINGVCIGESQQYGYMTAVSRNIGQLLDRMLKDTAVVVVVYNMKNGNAYIKKGCNINDPSDSKVNKDYVSFVVKSRVNIAFLMVFISFVFGKLVKKSLTCDRELDCDCFVCLEKIPEAMVLPCCKQTACADCLKKWFVNNVTCPHCRYNIYENHALDVV